MVKAVNAMDLNFCDGYGNFCCSMIVGVLGGCILFYLEIESRNLNRKGKKKVYPSTVHSLFKLKLCWNLILNISSLIKNYG
jgi:hypothetical protein